MTRKFWAVLACAAALPALAQQETVIIEIHSSEARTSGLILQLQQDNQAQGARIEAMIRKEFAQAMRQMKEAEPRGEGHAGLRPRKAAAFAAAPSTSAAEPTALQRGLRQFDQANYDAAEVAFREHQASIAAPSTGPRDADPLGRIEAQGLLAEVSFHRGDYPQAIERYRKALELVPPIDGSSGDDLLVAHAILTDGLASAYSEQRQRTAASTEVERALQRLAAIPPRKAVQRAKMALQLSISKMRMSWSDGAGAGKAQRAALAELRGLLVGSSQWRDHLRGAMIAAVLARIETDLGNTTAAEQALAEATTLYRNATDSDLPAPTASVLWQMHEPSDSPLEWRREVLTDIASVAQLAGHTAEAERGLTEALRMARQVPGDAGLAQGVNTGTLDVLFDLGILQLDTAEPATALATLGQARPLARSLIDAMPQDQDIRLTLASILSLEGETLVAMKQDDKAIESYAEAETIARHLNGSHSLGPGQNFTRMSALRNLADLKARKGQMGEVGHLLDDAIVVGRAYVAAAPAEDRSGAAYLCVMLLRQSLFRLHAEHDTDRARISYEEAQAQIAKAAELPPYLAWPTDVLFARTASALKRFDETDRYFGSALRGAAAELSAKKAGMAEDAATRATLLSAWAHDLDLYGNKPDAAAAKYAEAEALILKLPATQRTDAVTNQLLTLLQDQIGVLDRLGRHEQKLAKAEALDALLRDRPGIAGAANGVSADRLDALGALADAYDDTGHPSQAGETRRRAVNVARAYVASAPNAAEARFFLSHTLLELARQQMPDDDASALPLLNEAVAQEPRLDDEYRWVAAHAAEALFLALDRLQRDAEAERALVSYLRIAERVPGIAGLPRGENLYAANAYRYHGFLAESDGNYSSAAEHFSRSVAITRKVAGRIELTSFNRQNLAFALVGHARMLAALQRNDEAVARLEEAEAAVNAADPGDYFAVVQAVAPLLFDLGKTGRGAALLERAVDRANQLPGLNQLPVGSNIHALGMLVESTRFSRDVHDDAAALRYAQRASVLGRSLLAAIPADEKIRWLLVESLIYAGDAQFKQQNAQTALTQYQQALDYLQPLPKQKPDYALLQWRAQLGVGDTQFHLGYRREARAAADKALQTALQIPGINAPTGVNIQVLKTYRALAEQAADQFDTRAETTHYENALRVARAMQAARPQAQWLAGEIADIEANLARLRKYNDGQRRI